MDVSDISKMLAAQINSLVPRLLPGAVREGHEWRVGSVMGEKGRSLSIHCSGPRAGVWSDFSSDNLKGDALDLVAWVRFGGDKKQALAWARSWLGLDNMDPNRLKATQAKVRKESQDSERRAHEEAERRRRVAHAMWLNASKLPGTGADLYLAGRAIYLDRLQRSPNSIRFVQELDYPASMNNGVVSKWPAMVAAIINGDGMHIATHRTYLMKQGYAWVKAAVPDAKLVLGSYRGGVISLARGASGRSLKEAPDGDKVILCEGIEDGLSLSLCNPEYRVLAAVSVGNFKNIWLPATVREVVIAADNDPPESKAGLALQAAIDVFIDQGREVRVARSPIGKDFNDALRENMSAAAERAIS